MSAPDGDTADWQDSGWYADGYDTPDDVPPYEATADSYSLDESRRPDPPPCLKEVPPGKTHEQAEARVRADLATSHESVLDALARVLFGREQEQQREVPWSQPCVRYPSDRGMER